MREQGDARHTQDGAPKKLIPRTQLGGTDRRHNGPDFQNRPPVSSQELSEAPAELIQDRGPRVNWRVFIIASAIIIAFSVWAVLTPTGAAGTMKTVVAWVAESLGWFYVLTVTVVIGFVLWVALS